MDFHEHFRLVARVIREHSVFSRARDAWTISVPYLKAALQQQAVHSPFERPPVADILEEGVRLGFWEMDFDEEGQVDIVILN